MRHARRVLSCLLLFGLFASAALAADRPPRVKRIGFWESVFKLAPELRFGEAPRELVDYVHQDNIKQGYPQVPRRAKLDPTFKGEVRQAMASLPPAVKDALGPKFAGVYFIENLGSTGWSEEIVDRKGKVVAGVIVLDAGVLSKQRANAWATWKEGTPFRSDARWKLAAEIERGAQDTRVQAIQYILLHEIGHVLAMGTSLLPSSDLEPKEALARGPYSFLDMSWQIGPKDNWASIYDGGFLIRPDIVYYTGAKLDGARMEDAYLQLKGTNFATLYGATNPFDDFAEAFVNYVHVQVMKRPFAVRIYKDNKLVLTYGDCWQETRCAKKRRVIEQVLGITAEGAR